RDACAPGWLRPGDARLPLDASRSARRRAAARGDCPRRPPPDRRSANRVRRGERAGARARRHAAATPRREAGPRSRDGAVSERTLVLLSGAQWRAGRSHVIVKLLVAGCWLLDEARNRIGGDDGVPDAFVRRGGRTA